MTAERARQYRPRSRELRETIDLRAEGFGFPPVYDQSWLESCAAGAVAAALAYDIRRATPERDFEPSRLFVHYNERQGAGPGPVSVRASAESVSSFGVCRESEWPYDPSRQSERPPVSAYESASGRRGCELLRVERDLDALRRCLSDGYPMICGLWIHHSYFHRETRESGVVPFPHEEEPRFCGHAILIVGHDDARERFVFRNSLGESWGDRGHGYLSYLHAADPRLTSVFWVARVPLEERHR
jgi:C1A family cysteine protease